MEIIILLNYFLSFFQVQIKANYFSLVHAFVSNDQALFYDFYRFSHKNINTSHFQEELAQGSLTTFKLLRSPLSIVSPCTN